MHSLGPLFGEDEDENEDQDAENDDAFHRAGAFGVLFRFSEFSHALFRGLDDLLHVVVDSVEHGALIDDEHGELFKDVREFLDRLGDFLDFLVALICGAFRKLKHHALLVRNASEGNGGFCGGFIGAQKSFKSSSRFLRK